MECGGFAGEGEFPIVNHDGLTDGFRSVILSQSGCDEQNLRAGALLRRHALGDLPMIPEWVSEDVYRWLRKRNRLPLILLAIPLFLLWLIPKLTGVISREVLYLRWFWIASGIAYALSGLLYLHLSPHKLRRLWTATPLVIAGLAMVAGGLLWPRFPKGRLVIAIADFTPVNDGAKDRAAIFTHSLMEALTKKEASRIIKVKRVRAQVSGADEDEAHATAISLGRSMRGKAHAVLWGTVLEEGVVVEIEPRLTIVHQIREASVDEPRLPRLVNREPDYVEFRTRASNELADIVTFLYGVAFYRSKRWDSAVPLFEQIHSGLGDLYQGLCYYDRAAQSATPAPDYRAAVAAYRAALEVFTRAELPQQWAMTQNNLGNALQELGTRSDGEEGRAHLLSAIACYDGALLVFTNEHFPAYHQTVSANRARTMEVLNGLSD